MNSRTRLIAGMACWFVPLAVGAVVATLVATQTEVEPRVGPGTARDHARRPTPTDEDRLQGRWDAIKVERDGIPIYRGEESSKAWISFVGDKVTFTDGDVTLKETFVLDPRSRPKAFDLIIREEGRSHRYPSGISSLEDFTLRLCFAFPEAARPPHFATLPGSGHTLFEYRRANARDIVSR